MRSLTSPIRLLLMLLPALTGLFSGANLPAQESGLLSIAEPEWGAPLETVRERMGEPAFASASILNYTIAVAAGERSLAADLTFWFKSDALFFASYAFPVEGRTIEVLARDFADVSHDLKAKFGDPLSVTSQPDSFTTEVWSLPDSEVEHTVILDPARSDHTISMTARQQ